MVSRTHSKVLNGRNFVPIQLNRILFVALLQTIALI